MSLRTVDPQKANAALIERFSLQSAARVLLPSERVATCLRRPIPGKQDVEVWRDAMGGTAHYRNLVTCGRVWQCAVCAAKITEKRREEIRAVINTTGLQPYLATFTLKHGNRDALAATLETLIKAFAQFTSGRPWQRWREQFGLIGYVRALEVTHGRNGWHPHLHVLMLCDPRRANILEIRGLLSQRWQRAAFAWGGYASWAAGFDLKASSQEIADYIAKFGHEPRDIIAYHADKIDYEMTKTQLKRGRGGGCSMTELLRRYIAGDQHAGELWQEFSRVFKGRRMLEWSRSPDLRMLAQLGPEKTDEQLAQEHTEEAYFLARLSLTDWRVVIANDARGELLALARSGDGVAIRDLITSLRKA